MAETTTKSWYFLLSHKQHNLEYEFTWKSFKIKNYKSFRNQLFMLREHVVPPDQDMVVSDLVSDVDQGHTSLVSQ